MQYLGTHMPFLTAQQLSPFDFTLGQRFIVLYREDYRNEVSKHLYHQ